jgi:hypothetical protein
MRRQRRRDRRLGSTYRQKLGSTYGQSWLLVRKGAMRDFHNPAFVCTIGRRVIRRRSCHAFRSDRLTPVRFSGRRRQHHRWRLARSHFPPLGQRTGGRDGGGAWNSSAGATSARCAANARRFCALSPLSTHFGANGAITRSGIDITLEERLSHEIAPAVAQAHADIGVLTDSAGAEGLETYPFRIDRFVVVVPRGHALASRRDIRFVDVLDEDFVGLEDGSALAEHLAWQSARLGRSLRLRIRLRSLDSVCHMVECGVGIAVVPETAALRCRRTMALGTLRLVDPWATRQLIICARRLDALPVHARRLVEHLAEKTGTDPLCDESASS